MTELNEMLGVLSILDPPATLREVTQTCVQCGASSIAMSRDAHAPAEQRIVCADCSKLDRPEYKTDTGVY